MDIETYNNTKLSNMFLTPTFIWCLLMPVIHIFSLISNILCIIVFCSNTFIKKPIAIYFICLLISDSISLLIGYVEMIDRESNMIDKSSWLCLFNEKVIHKLTEFLYSFMERFCLEWMLYKVLWTRASTILLAILSVQRTRTFFSLSYRETRLCACFACLFSVIIALTITFLEWIGVQFETSDNLDIYLDIHRSIINNKQSKDFYSGILYRSYNESIINFPCLVESFDVPSISNMTNEFNCSRNTIASEFYMITKTFLTNRETPNISDGIFNILSNLVSNDYNLTNNSLLISHNKIAHSSEYVFKLFEKRSCQITINYSLWLRAFYFLHSVSFSWNRHTLAIFFGNALPSFIVVLANLLSIKVIYFSNSLKYLKQTTRKNRRKRRLQNDLRAFLVILIESFSVILISWGIPILLTMYHCHSLYVVNIATCPRIKDYLALFLFTDLFNSSTNCLLYSLSGKLFRRRFFCIIKAIVACGRGTLWNVREHSLTLQNPTLDRQLSHNNVNNFSVQSSIPKNHRHSERLSSPLAKTQNKRFNLSLRTSPYTRTNGQLRNVSDDGSLSTNRPSLDRPGEPNSSTDIESDITKIPKDIQPRKSSQSIRLFLMDKVRSFGSTSSTTSRVPSLPRPSTLPLNNKGKIRSKKKLFYLKNTKKRTTNLSLSSSSYTGSISRGSQRNTRNSSSKILFNTTVDNSSINKDNIHDNLTSL